MTYDEFSRPLSIIDPIKYSKQAIYNGDKAVLYSYPILKKKMVIGLYINSESPKRLDGCLSR